MILRDDGEKPSALAALLPLSEKTKSDVHTSGGKTWTCIVYNHTSIVCIHVQFNV